MENALDHQYLTGRTPAPQIGAPRLYRVGLRWDGPDPLITASDVTTAPPARINAPPAHDRTRPAISWKKIHEISCATRKNSVT